jgi:acetyl esterase/lipase
MYAMAATARIARLAGVERDPYSRGPSGVELSPSLAHDRAIAGVRPALHFADDRGDFADWQSRARAKLADLMGYPASRPAPAATKPEDHALAGGLRRRRVYLRLWHGGHAPLDLVWRSGDGRPLVPIICLQGTNSGSHLSWGEARLPPDPVKIAAGGDYARQAAEQGFAAFCLEQSCFGERRERHMAPRSASATIDAANHALLLGRTLLGERAGDVSSVVDWIVAGDAARVMGVPLDPLRVAVMGSSAGGAVALYAAALDTRLSACLASGCVGFVADTIARRRDDSGQNVIPGFLRWFETDDVAALCAPRPLVMVSGTRDHIFPAAGMERVASSARSAYEKAGAPAALVTRAPDGPHGFYPGVAWPALQAVIAPS